MTETASGAADPWAAHVSRFRVSSAYVTATPLEPSEADLTFLAGLTMIVEEGRYEALRDDGKGAAAPSVLEYGCFVREEGLPPPSSWVGVDSHVVVTGMHANGWPITIAGAGAIGHDEAGRIEISFERPPRMSVIDPDVTSRAAEER